MITTRELTIHRLYFTKSDCYNKSVTGPPGGIQVHSTGANNPYLHRYVGPDDGLLGPNKYDNTHNRPGGSVCANAYIGRLQDGTVTVYQALPWDMHCWLSGSGDSGKKSANAQGFIGFEVCEDARNNRAYFEDSVWETSVKLCAYLCWKYSLLITSVLDHSELHHLGMASDHGDITWWLRPWGLNMDAYRSEVAKAILEGVRVKYIEGSKVWYDGPEEEHHEEDPPVLSKQMIVVGDGYLNLRSAPNKSAAAIGKLWPGDTVTMTAEYPDGWAYVQSAAGSGYCMRKYLAEVTANPSHDPVPAPEDPDPDPAPEQPETEDAAALLSQITALTEQLRDLEDRLALLITGAVG